MIFVTLSYVFLVIVQTEALVTEIFPQKVLDIEEIYQVCAVYC